MTVDHVAADLAGMAGVHRLRYAFTPLVRDGRGHARLGPRRGAVLRRTGGQIAVMHRIVVEEKRWIGDGLFLHALNFCMLLPGPEAQQLATYIGWLMHGTRGAVIAGGLFILPGALAIMALSWVYVLWGDVGLVEGIFFGLKAAVLAIVVQALVPIGKRAVKTTATRAITALSFVGIFAFHTPFPLIVALAALTGYLGARRTVGLRAGGRARGAAGRSCDRCRQPARGRGRRYGRERTARGVAGRACRARPLAGAGSTDRIVRRAGNVFADIAVFFSKMAVVTFGGAYAVLAYAGQRRSASMAG